jgi:hypothetical protein
MCDATILEPGRYPQHEKFLVSEQERVDYFHVYLLAHIDYTTREKRKKPRNRKRESPIMNLEKSKNHRS